MNTDLELYKRRFDREKKARIEAEKLLEEKSLQLYESNQELLKVNANQEKIIQERTVKLRASESNYQSLVESISDLICKINLDGTISFVNKVTCLTLGYDMNEIIGKNIFDFVAPNYRKRAFRFTAKLFLSKKCMGYIEFPLLTKTNNEIWLGINIQFFEKKCLKCGDKPCYLSGKLKKITAENCSFGELIVVARDISQQLEAKRITEIQSERLKSNEKYLKTINQFATSILKHNTINDIVWEVMHLTIKELGLVDCVIYLFDEDKKYLVQRSAYGSKQSKRDTIKDPIIIPYGEGIVGTVAKTGKPELIADTSKDPRYIVDDQFRFSELTVPIVADGEVIGVIDTEHPEKNFYNEEHLERLETVSGLVSSRMKNAISQEKLLLAQDSLTKLSTAVEQSPLSIVITNVDGIIEFVNPTFIETTGYLANESIGKKTNILKSGAHPQSLYIEMWETIKKGEKWVGELINKRKNGESFWVLSSISPIKNKKGDITNFVAMQADISASKKLESDLIKAKENAEKANKAKSEFLANMSHEIRTPMNAILGFSEALYHDIDSVRHKKMIKSVLSSGNLLLALLNDILDLSKIEAGKLEISAQACDLNKIFQEIVLMFSDKAKRKGIEIKMKLSPNLPPILLLDEIRIKQVLFNLLGNAVKFTHQGNVVLKADFINESDKKGELFLEIHDTGIGIHKSQQKLIFEAFSQQSGQSNRMYGGVGLGLSITRRLLEKMNGNISVQSTIGKGSVFKVSLSGVIISSSAIQRKNHYGEGKDVIFDKAKVLVIDAVPLNINTIENFLFHTPISVLSADNGEIALEILNYSDPDLILLDIRMPGIDGYEVARRIRNNPKKAHIPIIAFTASVLSSDKIESSGNFDGFLYKPVNRNELFFELAKFLKHKTSNQNEIKISTTTSDFINFPSSIIEVLPEIIQKLETDFIPAWESVKGQFVLFKIEKFANDLNKFATNYEFAFLQQYAQSIIEELDIVDLEALSHTLDEFPKIINIISSFNKKYRGE